MLLAGIDEAGRGAVIGPLVVAGVAIDERKEPLLRRIGVRDSKLLSPRRRASLAKKIERLAEHVVVLKVSACRIDDYRKTGNLNKLEVEKFAEILNLLKPGKAFVDAVDVNAERFGRLLRAALEPGLELDIVSEHKADANYPVVGAASIIAKVERDAEIEEIKKKYGDVGPGYSSNPITVAWLKQWRASHQAWPDIVRKSWLTSIGIDGERKQKGILGFLKKKDECGPVPE